MTFYVIDPVAIEKTINKYTEVIQINIKRSSMNIIIWNYLDKVGVDVVIWSFKYNSGVIVWKLQFLHYVLNNHIKHIHIPFTYTDQE